MPNKRQIVFANGEFYHIFNRSNAGQPIFTKKKEIERALDLLSYYKSAQKMRYSFFARMNTERKEEYLNNKDNTFLVEIYAYALMPNHFHLLLKQITEKGIQTFLSNFQNSFARYFNTKNNRYGSLFQRPFKAKHIDSNEEFMHVSRYIHLNPITAFILEPNELEKSNITSFQDYLSGKSKIVNVNFINNIIGTRKRYKEFVLNRADYQRELANIKHILIE